MTRARRCLAILLPTVLAVCAIVSLHAQQQGAKPPTAKVDIPADALVTILRRQELVNGRAATDAAMRIALGATLEHPIAAGDRGLMAAQQEFDLTFGPPPMVLVRPNSLTLPSALGPATVRRDPDETRVTYSDVTMTVRRGSMAGLPVIQAPDRSGAASTPGALPDFNSLLIAHGDGNLSFAAPHGTWTINADPNLPVVYTGFNGMQWTIGGNPPPGASLTGVPFIPRASQGLLGSGPADAPQFAQVGGGVNLLPADAITNSDYGRKFVGAELGFKKRIADRPMSVQNLALNDWVDRWTFDGVNVTDAAAIGSSPTYYDFGAIEELEVTTGGNDALQLTGGVGINIVTKRGSNELHGAGRTFFTNESLQPGDSVSESPSATPQVNQILEFGGEVGGPIIKDRLWFWGSANRNAIDPTAFAGDPVDTAALINYAGKLSGQIVDGSEANVFYHFGDKTKEGRRSDAVPAAEPGFDLGSGTLGGDPSRCCTPGVQIMTLDFGDPATVPGSTLPRHDAARRFSLPAFARGVVAALKSTAGGSTAGAMSSALSFANHPIGMPPTLNTALARARVSDAAQAPATPALTTILQANGNSQGEAFEMTLINNGPNPLKVLGTGVVVEPVTRQLQNQLRQQLAKIVPGPNMVKRSVEAYCLQHALAPPTPGMLFQIAGPARQRQFKPAGLIMAAARQLAAAGALHPDSNPKRYLDSIKQYAIWTKFENWDMKKFGEALLEKTKQAAAAAQANWTGQMQAAVMAAVPNRWRDIQTVLSASQELAAKPQP